MTLAITINMQRNQFHLQLQTKFPSQGFTAIYGHSGAGKTSLLRSIAGLEQNPQTTISFNQQTWQNQQNYVTTQQRQIAYIFQDSRLFPHLTVQGNLEYAFKRRFNQNGPGIEQVCEWFGLNNLLQHNSHSLSGGEQQLVALARALLSSPQLILMDEPLGSLDSVNKEKILQVLENLHHQLSVPVIYVSHDIEEVSRLCDHLVILDRGSISAEGSVIELSSQLDLSLSHEENAATIIEATVCSHDQHYRLSELSIDQQNPIFVSQIDQAIDQKVRLRIPARDISLTLQPASDSSILNILPATVVEIEQTDKPRILIRLKVGKQFLLSRLTRKSVDRLQLTCGNTVYAQIKSVALLSERPEQLLS